MAQQAGAPLHRLLDPTSPDEVRCYASLPSCDGDPEAVSQLCRMVLDVGVDRIKLHEYAVPAIAAGIEALGDPGRLSIDVNCHWLPQESGEVLEQLLPLELGYVEEPLYPPYSYDALADLRRGGLRVAAGENAAGPYDFDLMFQRGAVDVAQPSVSKVGGVTATMDIQREASAAGVPLMPHCYYYGPGLLATAHVASALPNRPQLEMPYFDWQATIHDLQRFASHLDLPSTPGLGFGPDPDVMTQHLINSTILK